MSQMTHYDGPDVVVLDALGRHVPAVDEVRVEHDRAVVAIQAKHAIAQSAWGASPTPACAIHSARDGRLHWRGPVWLVYV